MFLQALGGTKKSRNLYCSACNSSLGSEVDAPFAGDFEFITTMLDVKRDRGEPPTLKATTTDGTRIYLAPGGIPSSRGPSSKTVARPDGKREVTILVPADRKGLHEHMLAKAAKELGMDRTALGEPTMSLLSTDAGTVNMQLALGGHGQARGVAKIALGFLALVVGDAAFDAEYSALRAFVAHGTGPTRAWLQPPFRDLAAPVLPASDGVQHRVILHWAGGETWAHVEVFGFAGYAVLLAEVPDQRLERPFVWGQNPTTGESGEGWAENTMLPSPARAMRSVPKSAIAELLATMQTAALKIAHERTIEEEIAIGMAGLAEDETLSEERAYQIATRIVERLANLGRANDRLDMSRPISDRQELEAIQRALSNLAKK